jgi:periplasmic copper chaperone A
VIPKSTKYAVTALIFTVGLIAAARAAPGGDLDIKGAWSRATPPGIEVGVAYLVIDNHGKPDRLLSVSSPIAKQTELHVSEMADGLMTMRHLNAVDIATGTPTKFEPGGKHIMLVGLKQPLKDGDAFPVTLTFENAGSIQVSVPIFGVGKTPVQPQ